MSPREVVRRIQGDETVGLLDVRRAAERQIVHLEDDAWVPMDRVEERLEVIRRLPRPRVVYCHHGIRSHRVVGFLRERGMRGVYNLTGGIDAWARTVDPGLPRY